MTSLNELRVRLVDLNDNTVDLLGVPWGFDIIFQEYITQPRLKKREMSLLL